MKNLIFYLTLTPPAPYIYTTSLLESGFRFKYANIIEFVKIYIFVPLLISLLIIISISFSDNDILRSDSTSEDSQKYAQAGQVQVQETNPPGGQVQETNPLGDSAQSNQDTTPITEEDRHWLAKMEKVTRNLNKIKKYADDIQEHQFEGKDEQYIQATRYDIARAVADLGKLKDEMMNFPSEHKRKCWGMIQKCDDKAEYLLYKENILINLSNIRHGTYVEAVNRPKDFGPIYRPDEPNQTLSGTAPNPEEQANKRKNVLDYVEDVNKRKRKRTKKKSESDENE